MAGHGSPKPEHETEGASLGRIRSPFTVTLLLMFLSVCSGCAARRTAFPQNYRLTKIDGTDFLLPPDFSGKAKDIQETPARLGKLGKNRSARTGAECSIHDRWFSLDRGGNEGRKNDWVAQLPAPFPWYHQGFYIHSHKDWNRYFAQIYQLEAKGCISAAGYEKATNWIEESMPTPAMVVSFFRETLDRRGFVVLRPGMRLFIERSIFRTGGAETVANYLGETKTYYSVVRRRSSEIGLKLRGIHRSKGLSRKTVRRFPDARLAHAFVGMHALRLFYLTLYVPPGLKRTSVLIGARNPGEMVRASRMIENDPEIPCRKLASARVTCVSLDGMVSASVEMNVRVNGKEKYFPAGTKIQSVLRSLPPQERTEAWKTLRIRRLFRGRHYDLEFRRNDPAVRLLVLFAGDQISWAGGSSPSSYSHLR